MLTDLKKNAISKNSKEQHKQDLKRLSQEIASKTISEEALLPPLSIDKSDLNKKMLSDQMDQCFQFFNDKESQKSLDSYSTLDFFPSILPLNNHKPPENTVFTKESIVASEKTEKSANVKTKC